MICHLSNEIHCFIMNGKAIFQVLLGTLLVSPVAHPSSRRRFQRQQRVGAYNDHYTQSSMFMLPRTPRSNMSSIHQIFAKKISFPYRTPKPPGKRERRVHKLARAFPSFVSVPTHAALVHEFPSIDLDKMPCMIVHENLVDHPVQEGRERERGKNQEKHQKCEI